jgi:hypothetical protein
MNRLTVFKLEADCDGLPTCHTVTVFLIVNNFGKIQLHLYPCVFCLKNILLSRLLRNNRNGKRYIEKNILKVIIIIY